MIASITKNEYLRIGAIPDICTNCNTKIEGRVDNCSITKTTRGEPYRISCKNCLHTFEAACPTCGGKRLQVESDTNSATRGERCIECNRVLKMT